ncbi:hypothetical protein 035JT004_64 [Bacillus phage 035JT004]|nr:hypothetical protein 035JT004_64 [Bacillus phage 035JT004]
MNKLLKRVSRYIKSDVELGTTTVWEDGKQRIDGFYFYSKAPFSRSYQYHGAIGLDYTYLVLQKIDESITKNKSGLQLTIRDGPATERIKIHKGSLQKARDLMYQMIEEVQKQY